MGKEQYENAIGGNNGRSGAGSGRKLKPVRSDRALQRQTGGPGGFANAPAPSASEAGKTQIYIAPDDPALYADESGRGVISISKGDGNKNETSAREANCARNGTAPRIRPPQFSN
jgi:hypothetical protein